MKLPAPFVRDLADVQRDLEAIALELARLRQAIEALDARVTALEP